MVVVLAALVLAAARIVRMTMIVVASFILYSFISKVRQVLYWNVSVLRSRYDFKGLQNVEGVSYRYIVVSEEHERASFFVGSSPSSWSESIVGNSDLQSSMY